MVAKASGEAVVIKLLSKSLRHLATERGFLFFRSIQAMRIALAMDGVGSLRLGLATAVRNLLRNQ